MPGTKMLLICCLFILCSSNADNSFKEEKTENASESPKLTDVIQQWRKLGEHGIPVERGILELDYSIGGTDFYSSFIRKRTPVVFRGVANRWEAVKNWHNASYLKEKYGDVLMDVELGKIYRNDLYPRKTMNMSEFLDVYKENTVYLDSPFPQTEMMNDLEVPVFMQCPELSPNFTSAHLLFSSGNTSSCFHQDGYENLLTMISGIKVITLVNYTYMKEVYADHIDTFPGLSPISPEGVDFDKWPLFKGIPFHKITLQPGDMVYIPKNWWHHVRSFESPNIGVSIWFHVFANMTEPGENEEVAGIRDVLKIEEQFAKVVDAAPEKIECKTQNIPVQQFLTFEQTWNMPKEDNFVQKRVMLKSGFEIPAFGYGTAGLFEKTEEMVKIALKEGYRLIDSAQAYDESGVGQALKSSGLERSELFLVSKVHPKNLGFETTIQSVHESLSNLQTDYIDLMLIHSKDCDEGPDALLACGEGEPKGTWVDTWKALEFMVEKGKIRSIGVSNFELEDLKVLQNISEKDVSAVQNWFDPFNTDDDVRKWCKENGVAYMGHSTLGDSWVREGLAYNPVLQNEGLLRIARNFDADIPRVVLRWALGNDVIVIPRSSNPSHIATNIRVEFIEFQQPDIDYINSLKDTLDPDPPSSESQANTKSADGDLASGTESGKGDKPFVYSNVLYEEVSQNVPSIFLSSDDFWIYAFDAQTGKIKWKTETADETGSSCDFSLNEDVIYCGADDSYVRALHTSNGSLVWKFKTGSAVTSSCHVTKDGTIVVGSHDSYLYALSPDGSLRWRFLSSDAIWSSPVSTRNGDVIFIASFAEYGDNIYAVDVKTGKTLWSFQGEGGFISSPSLSPDESVVVFCSGYGFVYALDPYTGDLIWKRKFVGTIESTPVFTKNSRLFITTHKGEVVVLDSRKGKTIWSKRVSVNITSSPTLGADGQVFVAGGDGEILSLSQKNGDKIWTKKIGSMIFISSPRLAKNGMLYVATADKPGPLFALNSENGEILWRTDTNGPIVGTPLIARKFAAKYY